MTAHRTGHRPGLAAQRLVAAPVAHTMAVLMDLRRHAAAFPCTTVAAPPPPPRVGDRFVAVTARVVRDEMVLVRRARTRSGAQRATFGKVGGLFRGTVVITVAPAQSAPAQSAPAQPAPAQPAPAQSAPAQSAPAPLSYQPGHELSRVVWSYDVVLARGPHRLTRWPATLVCTLLATRALRSLAAQAEGNPPHPGSTSACPQTMQ